MRLAGKIAAITGGGSGIGRACALAFAQEGADVAVGDLDASRASQVADEVQAIGRKALALQIDVTEQADLDRFADGVVDQLGGLTVWVGSAGLSIGATVLDHTRDDWRRVMDLNVDAVVFGAQAAARRMVPNGTGSIINISSIYGARAVRERLAYCTSKAAVIMATQVMAVELAEHGVRANAIGPGYTDTPLFRGAREEGNETVGPLLGRVPAGRLGTPEEIAAAALFLASDESSFVTGQCVFADGGWVVNGNW
jgi:3-oxoacyl-[acyl-carrier protein] reductase